MSTAMAMAMAVLTHPFQVLLVAMVVGRLLRMALTSPGGEDPAYSRERMRLRSVPETG